MDVMEKQESRKKKNLGYRRKLQGVVISNAPDKTIVVEVERIKAHPLYKKYIKRKRRYMAHDANNEANVGDTVAIEESRPLSKRKKWRLTKIVSRGN